MNVQLAQCQVLRLYDSDGQDIRQHAERGTSVHLFVRDKKKRPRGAAAPFVYCGGARFMNWHGNQPITVRWKLSSEVPEAIWASLRGSEGAES